MGRKLKKKSSISQLRNPHALPASQRKGGAFRDKRRGVRAAQAVQKSDESLCMACGVRQASLAGYCDTCYAYPFDLDNFDFGDDTSFNDEY